MPVIAPFERRVINKGKREGALETARKSIFTAVEVRWGKASDAVQGAVNRLKDLAELELLLRVAMTAGTLEEFERKLSE